MAIDPAANLHGAHHRAKSARRQGASELLLATGHPHCAAADASAPGQPQTHYMPEEPVGPHRSTVDDPLADKRRRLGTALHDLARDLAEARRRNRQLERELMRLRTEKEIAG
jgi:hypothetical protein